jgi:hypothetical protein
VWHADEVRVGESTELESQMTKDHLDWGHVELRQVQWRKEKYGCGGEIEMREKKKERSRR